MDISYDKLYEEIIGLVRKSSKKSLENDDIIFLFSKSIPTISEIVKSKDLTEYGKKPYDKHKKLLSSNIYTDFYKLIKNPAFLTLLGRFYDYNKGDKNNKHDDFINSYRTVLDAKIGKIDSPITNKNINNARFFMLHKKIEIGDLIVPRILLSMYLESCIHMYHNLTGDIQNTYQITLTLPDAKNLDEIKLKFYSWAQYRVNLMNKLNMTQNSNIHFYKQDGDKFVRTLNMTEISHFNITQYFNNEELEKIKYLCFCRTESFGKTYQQSNEDINNFFNGPKMVKIIDISNGNNRDEIEYTLYQAIHTYEQIINELVITRYKYLTDLRQLFNSERIDDTDISNVISTLQQYLNYPLSFQYKFSDVESCVFLFSETTMKKILLKYLKLAKLLNYCEKNNLDMLNDPYDNTEYVNVLEELSLKTNYKWDDVNNIVCKQKMQNILNTLNGTIHDIAKHNLPNDKKMLSDLLKNHMLSILKLIRRDPMNELKNDYKLSFNIADTLDRLNEIKTDIDNIKSFDVINSSDYFNDINDEIAKFQTNCNKLKNNYNFLKTTIDDKINTYLPMCQTFFLDIKGLIDKSDDIVTGTMLWSNNTYLHNLLNDIHSENIIDYDNITIKNNPHAFFNDMARHIETIAKKLHVFDYLPHYFSEFKSQLSIVLQSLENVKKKNIRLAETLDYKKKNIDKKIKELTDKITAGIAVSTNQTNLLSYQNDKINLNELLEKKNKIKTTCDANELLLQNINRKITEFTINVNVFRTKMLLLTDTYVKLCDALKIFQNILKYHSTTLNDAVDKIDKFELHQIKTHMFGLLNMTYNNYDNKKNGAKYLTYQINQKSMAVKLLIAQILKNNKNIFNEYKIFLDDPTNITKFIDNLYGLDDDVIDTSLIDKYIASFDNIKPPQVDIKKLMEKYKINNGTLNISSYQLIDYFNKNSILNMGEKLYDYFVSINEINPLVPIENIINILMPYLYSEYNTQNNLKKVNINLNTDDFNLAVQNYSSGNLSKNNFVELLLNEFSRDEKQILENLLDNSSIAPNDNQNRIGFNPIEVIKLICKFDENKFIKKFFGKIRNANVLVSPNISAFEQTIIPFDDLFYYRHNIPYDRSPGNSEKILFKFGFFSLGSMCTFSNTLGPPYKIDEFSNKINKLAVQIIEHTNGGI